jgi:hypothetical protein
VTNRHGKNRSAQRRIGHKRPAPYDRKEDHAVADTMPVHVPTVAPGLNPGGLWVRLCTAHELLDEHPLNDNDADGRAVLDGELAGVTADAGQTVWCYVYDGDTGDCWATIITEP